MSSDNEAEREEQQSAGEDVSHLPKWVLLIQELMAEERSRRRKGGRRLKPEPEPTA